MIIALNILNIVVLPLLFMGVIRKVKALMQTRIGAPLLQPFYDFAKMMRKGETISATASWVFRAAPLLAMAVAAVVALVTPWSGAETPMGWHSASHFLLVLYLMSLAKYLSMLAAMDTGSAFGGLGASREATITMLVEPAMVVGFGAMALSSSSGDLAVIFHQELNPFVALLVGIALVMAAMAELSRMPVDDPTTHLELTMVHEAMILENGGRNLAITEYAVALRACVLFGLAAQTLLRVYPGFELCAPIFRYVAGICALFALGIFVAVAEGLLVKLKWRSVPNYLAFATVLTLMAAFVAVNAR